MQRSRSIRSALFLFAGALSACSAGGPLDAPLATRTADLRDMTEAEALQDLEQIFTSMRTLYGPLEYKEARFGFALAELEEQARARLAEAPGDDGFYSAANWFLSRFDDGHVALLDAPRNNPVVAYVVGIVLQPVEGKALVAELLDPSLVDEGIGRGDELVAIDGASPFALLDEIRELSAFGNELTNEHLIYQVLIRPGFAESLRPEAPTAVLQLRRADGSEYTRNLVWREITEAQLSFPGVSAPEGGLDAGSFVAHRLLEINRFAQSSIASLGAREPFFVNPVTASVFGLTEVAPNAETLARYGLDPAAPPDLYAALFSHAGKNLLLIRQPAYIDPNGQFEVQLQYYRALLDQFDTFVDGLVVDQTHNPGGNLAYCTGFARLFTRQVGSDVVQAMNTDRQWINDYRAAARAVDPTLQSELSRKYELRASLIEAAYDAGQGISEPIPFIFDERLLPDPIYVWQKPLIVLIDELAGSCGDVFPMLIKRNGSAPLFGRRTMGLGGNVSAVGPLANSQATLALTRGLFTTFREDGSYPPEVFVENNGIEPDIEHILSADDFRAGFVGYVAHFSDELARRIDAAEALAEPEPAEAPGEPEPTEAPAEPEPTEDPAEPEQPEPEHPEIE